jgi:transposase
MSHRVTNNYSEEFKQSSAKLAAESEQPISQTAKNLGINATDQRQL